VLGCALSVWSLIGRPASAATAKVALVHEEESTPLQQRTLTRLRAELVAAGFEVTEIERRGEEAREAAEAPTNVPGVFATIAIVSRSSDAADIWVADRITHKTVVRRINAKGGRDVANVLAVRAVELLQASLLEALEHEPPDAGPAPAEAAQPAPAPEPAVPPPEPAAPLPTAVANWLNARHAPAPASDSSSFGLQAGLGWLQAFGGIGGAILPLFGLSYRPLPRWSAALRVGGPAIASELSTPVGTESVRQALAWVEASFEPLGRGTVTPAILLGAGAYRFDVIGTAAAPYEGKSDGLTAAVFTAGGSARLRLGARVALVGSARLLWIAPEPVLLAAGTEVGSAGRPSLLADAMVDVAF
jgi:hypothetical protein